jgi:hypothetical protein
MIKCGGGRRGVEKKGSQQRKEGRNRKFRGKSCSRWIIYSNLGGVQQEKRNSDRGC